MLSYPNAITRSVLVHAAIGIVLVFSMEFTPPEKEPNAQASEQQPAKKEVIKAVSVDKSALEKQVQKMQAAKAAKQAAEEKRVAELEQRAKAAERARQDNESNIKKLAEQRKKAEAQAQAAKQQQIREAKRARELKKAAEQQAAEKRKAEAEAKKAKEAAKKAAEEAKQREEAAKKAEAERKKREQEAREQAEMQRLLEEQMAQEQAARDKQRRRQVLSEKDKYVALIRSAIQSNLYTDPSLTGTSCKLNIRLANNGFVTSVKTLSGNAQTCQAAEKAVYKTNQLPVSPDPDVTSLLRDINLTVAPEN
ncbi:cell envelope integrity protein TolA [Catenovulum adriaticum]|uniref:Cell envelope integrity protein TolA n=1 Tax=Catenovulum adriaticum TaxID=2984846 RepID=A0ABY7APK3_9ALTE|nr:cell envelope integrity protein TolA [Catenovulum sp. TS8]WAJ71207.1 cell envelope integrity protein TolA [Catenovulum sp. TS8]